MCCNNFPSKGPIRYRWLSSIKDERHDVSVWKTRNKVDIRARGAGINWSHSFNSYPPDEVRRANPDIMAMRKDGTRMPVPPKGAAHIMYCLSNPKLYDLYAERS